MKNILRLLPFAKTYWKSSLVCLALLTVAVGLDLSIPRLIQQLVDQGISAKNMQVVTSTSLLMLGLTLVNLVFSTGNSVLSVIVGEGIGRDMRQALFAKIQTLSFKNLDELQTGKLIVRMTSDVTQVNRLMQIMLRIGTRAPLMIAGSLILMVRTSPRLTLYLSPLLLLTAVIIVLFVSRLQPFFMTVQRKLDRLNTVLQENISGIRVVKAFVRSDYENQRFDQTNVDLMDRTIAVMRTLAFLMPVMLLLINAGIVLVVWAGGIQVIDSTLSKGEIIAVTNYLMTTMFPLLILSMIASSLAGAGASAERILEVLDSVPAIQDAPQAVEYPQNGAGKVVFHDVCFNYGGDCSEPVLNSIDLVAEPGETIAFLGSTGAGKTSLIDLIPRFYDVTSGSVTIDGVDVRFMRKDSLLSQIGVVMQESVLFSGAVRENIRYGRPEATDDEVIAAAKAAQAHDFIMEMPQGYDSQVAQRGANLSGGQKQRIAIARALLMQPKILIMDDSTSSVDVDTESKIQDALQNLRHKSTTFVVAQRISTVLNADKIVVLDRGRIVAQGTHQELLETSPIYQEIYESQLGNGVASYV
jgi:ATP-binding cassette subfamily B multidrug efflux pump